MPGTPGAREDLYAIGSLIEEAPLYPNLTARENLRVRTTLLGLPESRIDEVLAAVDLADTGKKRAGASRWACGSAWGSRWR